MSSQTIIRITRELAQIQKGQDLSLAVGYQDADVTTVKALVIGPPTTPYEYGFFEFLVKFTNDYPNKPPKVEARTTNSGRCRFNPNIYATGKVCLTILGTWAGETSGEEWSSAQGLESVLWSIQSLMSDNPYENEPGYDGANGESDKKFQGEYVAKIRHETIRIAVLQKVEGALGIKRDGAVDCAGSDTDGEPDFDDDEDLDLISSGKLDKQSKESIKRLEPFNDLYKQRFLWYYQIYCSTVDEREKEDKEGTSFTHMPFEGKGNEMTGEFQYSKLRERLERVKEVLDQETAHWATAGLSAMNRETGTAANLQRQFEQIKEHHKISRKFNVTMELENGNPFVWILTYFGKPSTNLDAGVFKIRVSLSPSFPAEQPRVCFETRIYHHRVARHGTLCYFPTKKEDMQNHLESIVDAIEDPSPPFDPRSIVNSEATKLLFGSEDDKKRYHRLLRRSAQATTEEV